MVLIVFSSVDVPLKKKFQYQNKSNMRSSISSRLLVIDMSSAKHFMRSGISNVERNLVHKVITLST